MKFDELCELYEDKEPVAGEPDLDADLKPVENFLIFIKTFVDEGTAPFHEEDMAEAAEKLLDELKPKLKPSELAAIRKYAGRVMQLAVSGGQGIFGMDAGPFAAQIVSGNPKAPNLIGQSQVAAGGMKPKW